MAKPVTVRVWTNIPESLNARLKSYAKRAGTTRDRVIAEALAEYLRDRERPSPPESEPERVTLQEFLNGAPARSVGQGGDEFCFARLASVER